MKVFSKQTTRKWLAGLLALAMICGIGPTYAVVNAETTPLETSVYNYNGAPFQATSHAFFSTKDVDTSYSGGKIIYYATEGGIYVNGQVGTRSRFIREGGNYFYVWFEDNGFSTLDAGTVVRIDGVFVADSTLPLTPLKLSGNFIWDGIAWYAYNDELECSAVDRADIWPFFTTSTDAAMGTGDQGRVYGGVYVKNSSDADFVLDTDFHVNHYDARSYHLYKNGSFTPEVGTELYIDGIYGASHSGPATKLVSPVWVYNGTTWGVKPTVEEISIYDSTRAGIGDQYLFFDSSTVTGAEFTGSDMEYKVVSGGLYLDDSTVPSNITFFMRNGGSNYYIWFGWFSYTPVKGSTIKLDGVFACGAHQLKVSSGTFVYDGVSEWYMYNEEVELTGTWYDYTDNIRFSTTDTLGTGSRGTIGGGAYFSDGTVRPFNAYKYSDTQYYVTMAELGLPNTPENGTTVIIDCVMGDRTYGVHFKPTTFKLIDGHWYKYEEADANALMTWEDTSFRFEVGANNVMSYEGNVVRRNPVSGGMHVDGELRTDIEIYQHGATSFHTYANGFAPADGTTMKIDAVLGNGANVLKVTSPTYIYQNGVWGSIKAVAYDAEAFADYRADLSAPTADGYVFAGWYEDVACKTALKADTVEGTAYAKFVNADVLTAKAQVTANIDDQTEKADIRFVTTVDSLNYKEVGFYITIGDADQGKKAPKKVYSTLYIVGKDSTEVDTEITPDEFCKTSEYFATFSYWNVGKAYFGTDFTVTPYWVTLDGTTVEGTAIVRSVNSVNAAYNQ